MREHEQRKNIEKERESSRSTMKTIEVNLIAGKQNNHFRLGEY